MSLPKIKLVSARLLTSDLSAFTLAEVLISLVLIGVIASFTLPKVLSSSLRQEKAVRARAVASMLSNAYHRFRLENTITPNSSPNDLLPYINILGVDTQSVVDNRPGAISPPLTNRVDCASPSYTCWRLKSGEILAFASDIRFNGLSSLNCWAFNFDPDGEYNAPSLTGDGKAQQFILYTDGLIRTHATMRVGTTAFSHGMVMGPTGPTPSYDATWFSWN